MFFQKGKYPSIGVLCGLIFPGLGQIYAGKIQKGLIFILSFLVSLGFLVIFEFSPNLKTNYFMVGALLITIGGLVYFLIDAFISCQQFNKKNNLVLKTSWLGKIIIIGGYILWLLILNPNVWLFKFLRKNVESFVISGQSMSPTLIDGDRFFVNKRIYLKQQPERGDIMVFRPSNDQSKVYVTRLIASGGESVEIKDGNVYVNGSRIIETNIDTNYYYNRGEFAEIGKAVVVPEGHCFVLGDNSVTSHDSRFWGFLPKENIIGKAYKIYWPINRSGPIH